MGKQKSFPILTGQQFVDLFKTAKLANLAAPDTSVKPEVTGDKKLDEQLRQLAEARGYVRQPEVVDETELMEVDGRILQREAGLAWLELKKEAHGLKYYIELTSAYRDYDYQRRILLRPLEDDIHNLEKLTERLNWVALPGYSKHQTGYALDFCQIKDGDDNKTMEKFVNTESYEWLAKDNYHNAKRFGFIPSYPPGVDNYGPQPEPWEFVYIGCKNIKKV